MKQVESIKDVKNHAYFLLISSILLLLVSFLMSTGDYSTSSLFSLYFSQPVLVLLNWIPFILLLIFGYSASNSVVVGSLFGAVPCLILSLVNYWKLCSRSEPLYASDIYLIKEAAGVSDRYLFIDANIAITIVSLALIVLFAVLLSKKTGRKKLTKTNLVVSLITVFISVCLYIFVYSNGKLFKSFKSWEEMNVWYDKTQYISNGEVYSFIYSINEAVYRPPFGYNKNDAIFTLLAYDNDSIPENKKANIIFVMLEAYSDLTKYADLQFLQDPYENYHSLEENCYRGKLFTNVFAGGTAFTERNVITGFSEQERFLRPSWSYARYFKENGYNVYGSHPGEQGYYSRNIVNGNLGFDDYRFFENYYNQFLDWPWSINDGMLLGDIASTCLKDINQGNFVFSFNVTIQNHGPYYDNYQTFENPYIARETFPSEQQYYIANNYLDGISKTGKEMQTFCDSFSDIDQPTIIVFFGDHKPWLGADSEVYTSLGIDIFGEDEKSLYNYYCTEYLIWGNTAAKDTFGDVFNTVGPTISPSYLMNIVFSLLKWEGPSYMKLSNHIMELLPITTTRNLYLEDNKLKSIDDLSSYSLSEYDRFREVQYYLRNDADGKLP